MGNSKLSYVNRRSDKGSSAGISRREFLVGAGAASALCIVGGFGLVSCTPKSQGNSEDAAREAYDIVIIGTGGAGMSAAIAAYDKGATNIVLLEKMGINGGNTNFSSSGMNASETKFQKAQGIEDSNDLFAEETFIGGHETANRELVDYMCTNSAHAIDWLDELGITLDNITLMGGMSVRRCHRPTDGSAVGQVLVPQLRAQIQNRDIDVEMNCQATGLILNDEGVVVGVEAQRRGEKVTFDARAVIVATGGLGANQEMVTRYRPDLEGFVTTNQEGATGDGYVLAENVGAELIQMDQIQIHPTVEQKTATLIAEGIRGSGAILVNEQGNRFCDEMSTRDVVSEAIIEQPNSFAWEIFDQIVYDANKAIERYDEQGIVVHGANISELAEAINADPSALLATLDSYNRISTEGAADSFGRTQGCISFAPGTLYAIQVAPAIHHEQGGIKINTK